MLRKSALKIAKCFCIPLVAIWDAMCSQGYVWVFSFLTASTRNSISGLRANNILVFSHVITSNKNLKVKVCPWWCLYNHFICKWSALGRNPASTSVLGAWERAEPKLLFVLCLPWWQKKNKSKTNTFQVEGMGMWLHVVLPHCYQMWFCINVIHMLRRRWFCLCRQDMHFSAPGLTNVKVCCCCYCPWQVSFG